MSVLQTALVFVLVPLAIYALIALLAAGRPRPRKTTRYRPGEPWQHAPVWWSASPVGAPAAAKTETADGADNAESSVGATRGGADGGW